jgi:serine/threonine protein kinase/tetratricopeptide (TPR) repeat protein
MCPSEEDLRRYLDEELGAANRAEIEAHIEDCPRCFEALLAMGDTDAGEIAGALRRRPLIPPRPRSPAPDPTLDPAWADSPGAEVAPKDTALRIPEGETTAGNQPTGRLSPGERDGAICDRFEVAWRAGSGPRIEDYLEGVEGRERADLLGKLLRLELELRVEKDDRPAPEPYRARWPEYRTVIDSAFDAAVPPQPAVVHGIELRPGAEPISGYRLVNLIDEGGVAQVWKAVGPGGIEQALKFVRLDAPLGPAEDRAINSVKHIRHVHLLALFGIWVVGRHLVIAMELAEGTLLDVFKEAAGRGAAGIPAPEIFEYFQHAARGIDYLNEPRHPMGGKKPLGVQHRDIKPANLLLVGGCVKVGDYGLARVMEKTLATASSTAMTPDYAAPERFNRQTSGQSDQYSLACTYCHMRGGQPPFTGTPTEIMRGHLEGQPDLSRLPERERAAVARALAKDPKDRWPSCGDFVRALRLAGPREVHTTCSIEPPKEALEQSARPFPSPETEVTLQGPDSAAMSPVQRESSSSSVDTRVPGQEQPADALVCDAEDIQAPFPKSGQEIPYIVDKPDDLREELAGDQGPLVANVRLTRPPGLSPEEKLGYSLGLALGTLIVIVRFGRRRKVITGLLLALAVGLALWASGVLGPKWSVFKRAPDSGMTRELRGAIRSSYEPQIGDFYEALQKGALDTGVTRQPGKLSRTQIADFRRVTGFLVGKKGYDRAIDDYNEAIHLDPKDIAAYLGRGSARRDKGEHDEAIADYTEAIRLNPRILFAYVLRGESYEMKGDYDRAVADYTEAIRLISQFNLLFSGRVLAGPYLFRGNIFKYKKEYNKAIADFNEAIRLDPKYAEAYSSRAWVWATCPDAKLRDGKRAVESATRACELYGWVHAYQFVTLAAAYAEAGDFAKAVEWQQKADDLYTDAEDQTKGRERLKLYRDRKPYREP